MYLKTDSLTIGNLNLYFPLSLVVKFGKNALGDRYAELN